MEFYLNESSVASLQRPPLTSRVKLNSNFLYSYTYPRVNDSIINKYRRAEINEDMNEVNKSLGPTSIPERL